jgi:DNA recombination protein RmuC
MESPDFVLLFIPIEPAFAIALNEDTQLYNKAFEKNIVLLRLLLYWQHFAPLILCGRTKNNKKMPYEIARQAGALYDKFEGFVTDLVKIGKKMDEAKTEYEGAMNKLVDGKGNLITSVQKLKIMGAKAKKSLPDAILNRANSSLENLDEE